MAKYDFEPLSSRQVEKVKIQIKNLKTSPNKVFHQFPLYHSSSWGAEMDVSGENIGGTYVYELTVDLPKASGLGNWHKLIKTSKSGGRNATKNSQEAALEEIKNMAITWLNAAPKK